MPTSARAIPKIVANKHLRWASVPRPRGFADYGVVQAPHTTGVCSHRTIVADAREAIRITARPTGQRAILSSLEELSSDLPQKFSTKFFDVFLGLVFFSRMVPRGDFLKTVTGNARAAREHQGSLNTTGRAARGVEFRAGNARGSSNRRSFAF